MAQMQVFVSHNHKDTAFCQALVQGLRDAGADVWYDEHNLGPGHVRRVIMRELVRRPVFIVVLSKAALSSRWVLDECDWAYDLQQDEPNRVLLPVVAESLERADFNAALYLYGLKRIEAPGMNPVPTVEAVHSLLHALALIPTGEALVPAETQADESVTGLLERAEVLWAQRRSADMLPLMERATRLDPTSFEAWLNLARALSEVGRIEDAFVASERALSLDPHDGAAWTNRGFILDALGRAQEAEDAYDRALALDPDYAMAWNNKGVSLSKRGLLDEALAASARALTVNPNLALAWRNRGAILQDLNRDDEALDAYDRALNLDPEDALAWHDKGRTLARQRRYSEALVALDRALTLEPKDVAAWFIKGYVLSTTRRYQEALNAYECGLSLEPDGRLGRLGWNGKARALRSLSRTTEAKAAERRAKELDV